MKEKHLRLRLGQDRASRNAVYFHASADNLPRPPWDVAFRIEPNTYRGETGIQILVEAIRKSGAPDAPAASG